MIFKTLPILAAAVGLAAASSSFAQPYQGDETYGYSPSVGEVVVTAPGYFSDRKIASVPVYFSDLDLNSPEGGYTLLHRINGAARQVCSPVADTHDLRDIDNFRACVHRAVDHAVADVGAPTVQDAYYDIGVGAADLPGGG
jgi:UrcA family protein